VLVRIVSPRVTVMIVVASLPLPPVTAAVELAAKVGTPLLVGVAITEGNELKCSTADDEMADTSLTGQMVVVTPMMLVTRTVEIASGGRLESAAVSWAPGQLETSGAHEITVEIEVALMVSVVRPVVGVTVALGNVVGFPIPAVALVELPNGTLTVAFEGLGPGGAVPGGGTGSVPGGGRVVGRAVAEVLTDGKGKSVSGGGTAVKEVAEVSLLDPGTPSVAEEEPPDVVSTLRERLVGGGFAV
jgi:hypothetical protein